MKRKTGKTEKILTGKPGRLKKQPATKKEFEDDPDNTSTAEIPVKQFRNLRPGKKPMDVGDG